MLPNKSLTPVTILEIVRRRIWLIAIPPIVGLFAALLYSSTIKNIYQSDMLIAIIPQRVPDSVVRTTVTLKTEERLDELTVIVKSRTNLERMIQEMDLYPEERERMPMSDVVAIMNRDLEVGLEPQRRGPRGLEPPHAFHVRFTYPDPQIAAQVTQKIGAIFVEENTRGRGVLAEATNAFLEAELDQARRRLEEQERRVEEFRKQHGKELPSQLQSNLEAARGLQIQVQQLVESIARDRDRKLMLERLYREAANDPVASTALMAAQPGQAGAAVPLEQQLAAAKASLAALETKYTASHPDVIRTKLQIAELEQRVKEEQKHASAGGEPRVEIVDPVELQRRESLRQMRAEIESLDRQMAFKETEERRLRAEIADYQRRIEAVPGLESEWVALNRDYDTIQTTYRELLAKAEAARMAVNLEQREIGEQFRIVDPARVPVHPVTSIRGAVNAGGLFLGLLFGLGLSALLELRDKSFRSQADVLEVLALPVLAAVPRIVDAAERARIRKRKIAIAAAGIIWAAGAGYVTWALKLWNSLV